MNDSENKKHQTFWEVENKAVGSEQFEFMGASS
jgi:hypothetical protein